MIVEAQEIKFTKTERKILTVLDDGMQHPRQELLLALDPDGLMTDHALGERVFQLKKKLRRIGHDIVTEGGRFDKGTTYRRVRLYTPEDRQ